MRKLRHDFARHYRTFSRSAVTRMWNHGVSAAFFSCEPRADWPCFETAKVVCDYTRKSCRRKAWSGANVKIG